MTNTLRLLIPLLLILACAPAPAALVSVSLDVTPMSFGPQTLDIDGDGADEFTFDGNTICTMDIPVSACAFTVSAKAREGIEFLVFPESFGSPIPLETGDTLGGGELAGTWAATSFNTVSVSSTETLFAGPDSFSAYPDYLAGRKVYAIGFREAGEDGSYRYGWIDVRLVAPVINAEPTEIVNGLSWPRITGIHYSDTFGEPLTYAPIPEPRHFALAAAAMALLLARRRSRGR